ncbi:MAG: hypothetical protein ACLQVN_15010 [Bryobacteraceae bacterium]
MKTHSVLVLLTSALVASIPVWAQPGQCESVGGVLITNIAAIDDVYNLGPVFGDLQGSVAAKIVGSTATTYTLQHYWVTTSGDTILFKQAVLTPTYPTADKNIVAVPWGNYSSDINGGTGKFAGASGKIDYFGMADFNKLTLVLRYSGTVCYPVGSLSSFR